MGVPKRFRITLQVQELQLYELLRFNVEKLQLYELLTQIAFIFPLEVSRCTSHYSSTGSIQLYESFDYDLKVSGLELRVE